MPRYTRDVHIDKIFLGIVAALLLFGLLAFISASFSVLAESSAKFYRGLISQILLGLIGGGIVMYITQRFDYKVWKKIALPIFIVGIIVTLLVFVPGIGFAHGGAKRWLSLGPFSFQPAELLKITYVIYLAAWLSWVKEKIEDIRWGLIPFGLMTLLASGVLLLQPDTGTTIVLIASGLSMYFVAGAKWRDLGIIFLVGLLGVVLLVATRPYLVDRLKTFADPTHDPLGSSYQIQQSLIAIGSGQMTGRGFGQSVQKFSYLPEPTGDAIFAVISEELGFIGGCIVLLLFLAFLMRGIRIARHATNHFGKLLALGLVVLITFQSFLNIASIIGVFPLTGLPLIFMSQGGTALLLSLFAVGIILNISKESSVVV